MLFISRFLARYELVRTKRRVIAMMFARLSVRLSVCLGRACIVVHFSADLIDV